MRRKSTEMQSEEDLADGMEERYEWQSGVLMRLKDALYLSLGIAGCPTRITMCQNLDKINLLIAIVVCDEAERY